MMISKTWITRFNRLKDPIRYAAAGLIIIALSLVYGSTAMYANRLANEFIWRSPQSIVPVYNAQTDMPTELYLHTSDGRDVVCKRTDDLAVTAYNCEEEGGPK